MIGGGEGCKDTCYWGKKKSLKKPLDFGRNATYKVGAETLGRSKGKRVTNQLKHRNARRGSRPLRTPIRRRSPATSAKHQLPLEYKEGQVRNYWPRAAASQVTKRGVLEIGQGTFMKRGG